MIFKSIINDVLHHQKVLSLVLASCVACCARTNSNWITMAAHFANVAIRAAGSDALDRRPVSSRRCRALRNRVRPYLLVSHLHLLHPLPVAIIHSSLANGCTSRSSSSNNAIKCQPTSIYLQINFQSNPNDNFDLLFACS